MSKIENEISIKLNLGDIIEIFAPNNDELNNKKYFIDYIDEKKIKMISLSNSSTYELKFNNKGGFTEESIESISIINRSETNGYAKQNGLIENTWIHIHIGGDIPEVITGEICNVFDDVIEITTWNDLDTLFIDFGYKGIPEDIPIIKIVIGQKPSTLSHIKCLSDLKDNIESGTLDEVPSEPFASIDILDNGESIISIPDDITPDLNVTDNLNNLYIEASNIKFGKILGRVKELEEVPEDEQRFDINTQTNDLMDKLFSTIPDYIRNNDTDKKIHTFITRFKQLRNDFSKFDDNNTIFDVNKKSNGGFIKPLIDSLNKFDNDLLWIIPTVCLTKLVSVPIWKEMFDTEYFSLQDEPLFDLLDKYYKQKQNNIEYTSLLSSIDYAFTPFKKPNDTGNIIANKTIEKPIEAVIDNVQGFISSTVNSNNIIRKKFVNQRFVTGSEFLKENNLKYYKTPATDNDNMHIRSFIMMPKSVIDFSKINLHNTNILTKSLLNQNYLCKSRLFNSKTNIHYNSVNDFNNELEYKKYNSSSNNDIDLLKHINYFSLSDIQNEGNYNSYLECIIPKTANIINILRKHMTNIYSFNAMIDELEPFLIYKENISYTQFKDIRYIIKQNVAELRKHVTDQAINFNKLRTSYKSIEYLNNISNALKDSDELYDNFKNGYLLNDKMTESEVLNKIYTTDSSLLFSSILSTHMNVLNTPKDLINMLEKTDIDIDDVDNIYSEDCSKRYLTKKYKSLDDLQNDNGIEIYFDKEYDDTPYEILKKYENEMKNMSKTDFIAFLIENLKFKHNITNAVEMAQILYNKQKPVEDNHYCLLEISPLKINPNDDTDTTHEGIVKTKKIFYKRIKNVWIQDDSINDYTFMDTNSLFCNVSDQCFKNTENNNCENISDTNKRIQEIRKKSLLDEFENRYTINADELQKQNNKRVTYYNSILNYRNIFNDTNDKKHNNLALLLASMANTDPVIKSPYQDKLNIIISDTNFVKKQNNIIKFVKIYTKESTTDKWWFYCKETNVKLIPTFIYELAIAFCIDDNYNDKLNYIKSTRGDIDGKYIIDKYSNWKIALVDDEDEEKYTQTGQKIITNDFLQKDIVISNVIEVPDETFENERSEKISIVFKGLQKSIGFKEELFKENVIIMATEIVEKDIMSENKYNLKIKKKKEKTGKDSISYNDYLDETIIFIVSSCVLLHIQCSNDISIKKIFPGCVKSFSGFPLSGIEDLTGIKYISCILTKIKSSFDPWNSIKKYNDNQLINRIKSIIESILIKQSIVIEMIRKRKEYILLNPQQLEYKEVSVEKWMHFLPPLVKINLPKNISNVSPQFIKEAHNNVLKSKMKQFDMLNTITGKNYKLGLLTIQAINNIVRNEPLLLTTVSLIPYVDNACCNENTEIVKVIDYFKEKDETIKQTIKSVISNSEYLQDIKSLSRASLLIHKDTFTSLYPEISNDFTEETIFKTFIHYGRYDTIYDVPLKYKNIIDEKPDGYDPKHSIEEKIVFLKKNGRKFTFEGLKLLLNSINKNNKLNIKQNLKYNIVDPLIDFIIILDKKDSKLIDSTLRNLLSNVINDYKVDKYYLELNANNRKLKNYLLKVNKKLLESILDFFYTFGSLKENIFYKLKEYLFNITYWNIDNNNNSYYDNGISNIITFIKNIIYDFVKFYPSLLVNGKINNTIHKHWGLSDKHNNELLENINNYYKSISSFINDDSLYSMVNIVTDNIKDISTFIDLIPIHTPFKNNDKEYHTLFDKQTILELYKYSFFSCLYEYIITCDNEEIFNINLENNKKLIKENRDTFNELGNIEEVQITTEKIQDIKTKIASLLFSFISIDMENKKIIDYSYDKINKYTQKDKKQEKDNIVDSMGELHKPERTVENQLKKYKIGKWDLANQKGFASYDADAWDNDTMRNIFNRNTNNNEDTNFILDTDNGITETIDEEYEQEGRDYDISHLGEDFYDGHDGVHDDYDDDF
jgi:hypothetical protein